MWKLCHILWSLANVIAKSRIQLLHYQIADK